MTQMNRKYMKIQHRIAESGYKSDGFIGKYQKLIKDVVVPYQYRVLKDEAEGVEKSHVVANFVNAGKALRGENVEDGFYGMVFQDSDAGKWIEAAAYSLMNFPDEELEKKVDDLIDLIADAQDSDGYLDTYFTIENRKNRWTNLLEAHELYCAGHLMEGACAYYEATGKRKFLDVMLKNAEHIYRHFVAEKREGFPGHPEVELALMKMYRATGEEHCLELCRHFINTRGVNPDFYQREREQRDWTVWGNNPDDADYQQSGKPVREQTEAVGHAVRAVYLYTGMADLASQDGDMDLFAACKRLWKNITETKMYLTGGIGSTVHGEAFSTGYDLPPDTAYAETCASIGLIFFASRMLEMEVDGSYADVMEQAFYNTVLAGMQLNGEKFFYVNPLEVVPGVSGVAATHRHVLTQRPKWYACACCPPNVARLISSFGSYAYGENENTVYCHLYAPGEVEFENGLKLSCETDYPYGFKVTYRLRERAAGKRLAVRIPHWSGNAEIFVNGEKHHCECESGYIYLEVKTGDVVMLQLDGMPRFVYANRRVSRLTGMAAVCRGPLVYCFEGRDNEEDILSLSLKADGEIMELSFDENLLGGTLPLQVEAVKVEEMDGLYTSSLPETTQYNATAIPYYTWGNRGENQMRVWMPLVY